MTKPEQVDAQEYEDDYVFRGDFDHNPNEHEHMLITDALLGFECENQPFIAGLQSENERLRTRDLQAINLMGAAIMDRLSAAAVLAECIEHLQEHLANIDTYHAGTAKHRFLRGNVTTVIDRAKSAIKKADADIAHNAEFERIQTAAKRYEILRTLNPRQFADLYARNIETGVPFDELVDAVEVAE